MRLRITGIDPGLVHSGVVTLLVDTELAESHVLYSVVDGSMGKPLYDIALAIGGACMLHTETLQTRKLIQRKDGHLSVRAIEAYRSRATSYSTDEPMRQLVAETQAQVGGHIVDNTGVKKVVRQPLMRAFGLVGFPTTHHGDLESAARIGMYLALKGESTNEILSVYLKDCLDGITSAVTFEEV